MLLTPLFSGLGLSWLSANRMFIFYWLGKRTATHAQDQKQWQLDLRKIIYMCEPLPSPTSHLHRRQEIFPPNQKNVTWYRERDIGTWHWYVTFVRDVEQSHRTVSFKSYEMKIPTCPLSLTATFSTAPPCSYVIGGVSLHPPERSIRAEIKHLTI